MANKVITLKVMCNHETGGWQDWVYENWSKGITKPRNPHLILDGAVLECVSKQGKNTYQNKDGEYIAEFDFEIVGEVI